MGQAEIGLLILIGVFFLGYGVCYWFQVRPHKKHIVWLNSRLETEHQSHMAMLGSPYWFGMRLK